MHETPELSALIGSRICHDLISPLGAIGNGLELLRMGGGGSDGPEMALISESVANANARIRFFRLAYGATTPGQTVSPGEIRDILRDLWAGSRLDVVWLATRAGREEVKLSLLLLQCLEVAMPWGGRITVDDTADGGWRLVGEAMRLKLDPAPWQHLLRPTPDPEAIGAAQVQFLLAPPEAARQGRRLDLTIEEGRVTLRF